MSRVRWQEGTARRATARFNVCKERTAMTDSQKMLLKPGEAALVLSISARKLWDLTDSGNITCVRIGRSVRYDPMDLKRWIDSCKRHDASA